MKTLSNFYLAGFSLVTVIMGLLTRSWVLLVLALPPLSLLVVGLNGVPKGTLDIEISRNLKEGDIHEGDNFKIKTTVKNTGETIRYLEILDEVSPRMNIIKGTNHIVTELKAGEEMVIEYILSCPVRGDAEIGPIHLRYKDPLALYFTEWIEDKRAKVTILPRIEEISKVYIRPKYTRNWLGNIQSGSMGSGTEFFALREYLPGDTMKRINWKATARHMYPVTNEFEGENSGDVIIVVDAERDSNLGTVELNTNNVSVRAAASLASSILADRNRVGLVVLGDYLDWLYPAFGREQFHRVMDVLARPTEGGVWHIEEAKWVINRFFPRKTMVIIISPLIDSRIVETVMDLWRGNHEVMVVSPSPVELEKMAEGIEDGISESILNLERQNIIDRIWHYAVVVDWDPREPLEVALEVVRRYQMRRGT